MPDTTALAYLVLKTAQGLFGKSPSSLAEEERQRVVRTARKQFSLENKVLSTLEARAVVVPEVTVRDAMDEILNRYPSEEDLVADLAGQGLDPAGYAAALERELKVNAVLDQVGARAVRVSDIDAELYYHYHPEQFQRPETRTARHILITINDDLAENGRADARARIDAIAARLAKDPKRFEEQALKHSECPTALNGGLMGEAKRDQLYPELDAVLFQLEAMELSEVLESPIGFHILRCDAITPAGLIPLRQAKEKVREHLQEKRRQTCIRAWLKSLDQAVAQLPESESVVALS